MKLENNPLFADGKIRTNSGIYIDPINPNIEDICIEDIAHALSHQCRFAGHINSFYSVAQHSIFCCENVSDKNKIQALLHDASEAYLVDIPSPIKPNLENYKKIEDNLMQLIAKKFNFQWPMCQEVKDVDLKALKFEWENLMVRNKYHLLHPMQVKNKFLLQFKQHSK